MFFEHKIIENFLNEQDFSELNSLKLVDVKDNENKIYNNRIFKDGNIESSCISNETIKRLHNNYHSKAINLLKIYAPGKENLYEYSDFHIVTAGKDHSFPIHTDTLNKLLSGVIYLSPDINNGTILYSMDKKHKLNVEWKKNRALFFSRSDKTLHSYGSDGKSKRVTLIYNLMTNNIKGVCKLEKKNYLYFLIKQRIVSLLNKIFASK